jgi:hypothetical protein
MILSEKSATFRDRLDLRAGRLSSKPICCRGGSPKHFFGAASATAKAALRRDFFKFARSRADLFDFARDLVPERLRPFSVMRYRP